MIKPWIKALGQLEAEAVATVMITVVEEQGSTPRNAGAKMLVTEREQFDTIGGGHLEYKTIKLARQLLADRAAKPRLECFSLGASLGQCCGGATTLLFEPLGSANTHIVVFGAGHVGKALIPILSSLPCNISWIDSRAEQFPEQQFHAVEKIVSEDPVDEVANQPSGAYYIVMTHDHQLDQALAEKILARQDAAYFGLIGSQTKRKKFEHRLKAKGFNSEQLQQMICPMGVEQVRGKLPAEIAVSVAAQVIASYNAAFGQQRKPQQRVADGLRPCRTL